MLQFINDLPDHVVGIHAIGEVSKEDYDKVLAPRLEDLVKRQGEINYLLVLENTISDFTAGAWYDEVKLGLKHFTKWKKIAVVTDQSGIQWFTSAFKLIIPGEAKGFKLDELDQAVAWVTEKEEKKEETK
ncbi:STAS/SEC14 domain-containing protein [Mucilaginibacter koreensis]